MCTVGLHLSRSIVVHVIRVIRSFERLLKPVIVYVQCMLRGSHCYFFSHATKKWGTVPPLQKVGGTRTSPPVPPESYAYVFRRWWRAILRHNDFGLIYEISKDIATARNKNGNFRRHHSHLMPPIQRTPMNVCITLMSSESPHYISAAGSMGLSLFKFLWRASNRQAHNVTERIIVFQGHPRSSILVPIESACTYP